MEAVACRPLVDGDIEHAAFRFGIREETKIRFPHAVGLEELRHDLKESGLVCVHSLAAEMVERLQKGFSAYECKVLRLVAERPETAVREVMNNARDFHLIFPG